MHEVHCVRNITLCPHCDNPIAKSDLDRHVAEQHTKVACPQCSALLPKSEVDQHIADVHATEPCPECGENVSRSLLEDHKCAVHRTTACPLCHRVVEKTNLHQHQVLVYWYIHCVSKKVSTFKLSVILTNLNRFSDFLHCWKACEIS